MISRAICFNFNVSDTVHNQICTKFEKNKRLQFLSQSPFPNFLTVAKVAQSINISNIVSFVFSLFSPKVTQVCFRICFLLKVLDRIRAIHLTDVFELMDLELDIESKTIVSTNLVIAFRLFLLIIPYILLGQRITLSCVLLSE